MKKKIIYLSFIIFFQCDYLIPKSPKNNHTIELLALATLNTTCSSFYAVNYSTGEYECISSTLAYSDSKIEIYVQDRLDDNLDNYGISIPNYSSIGQSFSSALTNSINSAIGNPSDINSDNKITILILDIQDGSSGGGYIAGYVDPINFFIFSPLQGIYSNQREIIYIDGLEGAYSRQLDLANGMPDPMLATLAHEYQHLVRFQYEWSFSTATSPLAIPSTESEISILINGLDVTWIDEGTSELISDIAGFGPQSDRLACFRGDPTVFSICYNGIVGRSFFDWNSSIMDYSQSYVFMKYLYSISGNSTTTRNSYLKNTVQGNTNGTRGHTTSDLMSLFTGTENYNSTILGTTSQDIFNKIYASQLAQLLKYPTASTTIYFGSSTNTTPTLTQLVASYPLPTGSSDLGKLITNPSYYPLVSAGTGTDGSASFDLYPSQMFRVKGGSSGPSNSSFVVIKETTGVEYIIFNGSISADVTKYTTSTAKTQTNSKSNTNSSQLESIKPIWEIPEADKRTPVYSGPFLKELLKYNLSKNIGI